MRYIVVVGVVALVALCKADGVDMDRDDCSKSMSRYERLIEGLPLLPAVSVYHNYPETTEICPWRLAVQHTVCIIARTSQ